MGERTALSRLRGYPPVVVVTISLGIVLRLAAWLAYSPSWKTHAHLYPMHVDVLTYVSDFVSYVPGRLPFFNVFSFVFYRLTEPLFGTRALASFALFVSVVSLPFLYEAVRELFDQRTATFSLILYALYPKLLVLTAWGMSEAGTTGFIVFTLFATARALDTERTKWYLLSGVLAALALLTYLSTVVFTVVLSVALYLKSFDWPPSVSVRQLLPDRRWWAYTTPPGIVGLLYLRYGPLLNDIPGLTLPDSLFVGEYTLFGNTVRYLAYTFFDFWWHTRGFDHESGIVRLLGNVESLFGPLFPVYLIGWSLVTVTLTAFVVVGLIKLSRQRGVVPRFVVAWAGVYVLIKLGENFGWEGTFQTRHLIAVFPAFVVAFGVGVSVLLKRVEAQKQRGDGGVLGVVATVLPTGVRARTVLTLFLVVGLVGLGVNATVNGALRPDHKVEQTTAAALESQADADDVVAAVDYTGYAEILVYTHGRVVPRVLLRPGNDLGFYERPGPLRGVVYTTPETLANTSIDYVVAQTTCHEFNQRAQSYLTGAERVGTVTYNETFEDAGVCTSHAKIVKID